MKKALKIILGKKIIDILIKVKGALTNLRRKLFESLRKIRRKYFPDLIEESKETIYSRERFYSQFIRPDDLVFDVGANIGNRSRPFLNLGSRVVAVEPQKECQRILRLKFGNRINIVPLGLGDKEGVKNFFLSNANIISSFSTEWIESVKESSRFKDSTWSKPIKIKITTLDKLIEKYGVPEFIKIDVEGYELEVLKGLSHPVNLISYEYTVPEQVQTAVDCISQIQNINSIIECNFSSGESMELVLDRWMSASDFKHYICSKEFISTGFGDIYVRKKNQ